MKVSNIHALRGPNLWSQHTAIEAIVSCSVAEYPIDKLPRFITRLREYFPEAALLQPARHYETMIMAHVLEFAALGLQMRAGCPVSFSHTVQTLETGTYRVVVEYSEEAVGRAMLAELEKTARNKKGFINSPTQAK